MAEINLTMSDSDSTVSLHKGDRVVLSLPENPSTGFRWILPDTDAVEVLADANVAGGPGIGAEGLRAITLRPTRPGPVALTILRRQEWESEETADARFVLKLDVTTAE
jgi:inhibitor of cysteine peptidase